MKKEIKVGTIQLECTKNPSKNQTKIKKAIKSAASTGAKLIVLQELHDSLYFCQTENSSQFDYAVTIPGPTTEFYSILAKKYKIVLVTSLFEKRTAGLYHNTAVVFENDGSIVGKYRKMHVPDDPGYYEKFYFTPGDLGFQPIKTSLGKLGVLICWDQWFPEAARLMALKGADLLIYPTAIGFDKQDSKEERERQLNAWKIIQQSHAIANGIPIIVVNRTGIETAQDKTNKTQFWGSSFIAGAQGEVLFQAPKNSESIHVSKISLNRTEEVRRTWPFLRDRRIDEYIDLTKVFID
jgi:N-carbamoylputrescine amidase